MRATTPPAVASVDSPRRADEPQVGILTWHRTPRQRPLTLAVATDRRERQAWMETVFAAKVQVPAVLPRVDATVVDTPALLAHPPVVPLLAGPTVALWGEDDTELAVSLLRAGADALLSFDVGAPSLRVAVSCVLRGEAVVPASVAAAVVQRVRESELT